MAAALLLLISALLSDPFAWAAKPVSELQCAKCHEDVKISGPEDHQDLSCEECHTDIHLIPGREKAKNPHQAKALKTFTPKQICAECHEKVEGQISKSVHEDLSCAKCHGSVHKAFETSSPETCANCHEDVHKDFKNSVHASEDVSCKDCHGSSHRIIELTDPKSPMSPLRQPETCGKCHDDPAVVQGFLKSAHGRGLMKSGLKAAPSCSACHGTHGILEVDDDASKTGNKKLPKTCGSCHEYVFERWKESVHGQLWLKGETGEEGKEGPVCSNCHRSHSLTDPIAIGNRLKTPEKCEQCHEEQYTTYRDSFHGKATSLGFVTAANCSDCHSAHDMLPADNPKSWVNPANLRKTCGECHGQVSASFVQYDPHLDPKDPEQNPPVHYVWVFMNLLLAGTFGFFVIHTLLWSQRSVVAFTRGELHSIPRTGEVWVRRFKPVHSGIHIVIIISFLLLALTGLPLKFHFLSWAPGLSRVFGGVEAARIVHRLAGVVTFGYSAFYLGYLLREVFVRRNFRILWGWQSMVPNLKDLRDVLANFRWFLYLGRPPRLDRWTYWEKFDYFAVFWGVPVIGLSGLMLWFPKFVTNFLPGWVLNLAYIVHSDEALLATGFIFFFHFFHTHLRPENFPLDPVMFLGRMPLERLKEERPAEYERLSRSGELERVLAPAPTEKERRRAYVFGFITLAIGWLLGLFLIIAGWSAIVS